MSERVKVLMVIGSQNVTVAFKSMLVTARDLRESYDFVFLLNSENNLSKKIENEGFNIKLSL